MPSTHIELLDNQWKQQHNNKPILLSLRLDSLLWFILQNREERCYPNKIQNTWHGFGSWETKIKETRHGQVRVGNPYIYYKNILQNVICNKLEDMVSLVNLSGVNYL